MDVQDGVQDDDHDNDEEGVGVQPIAVTGRSIACMWDPAARTQIEAAQTNLARKEKLEKLKRRPHRKTTLPKYASNSFSVG
jgi:hypothetical protein